MKKRTLLFIFISSFAAATSLFGTELLDITNKTPFPVIARYAGDNTRDTTKNCQVVKNVSPGQTITIVDNQDNKKLKWETCGNAIEISIPGNTLSTKPFRFYYMNNYDNNLSFDVQRGNGIKTKIFVTITAPTFSNTGKENICNRYTIILFKEKDAGNRYCLSNLPKTIKNAPNNIAEWWQNPEANPHHKKIEGQ